MSLLSIDEAIAAGMGRAATVGAFSTGIVGGGAGTILDIDQPEFALGVPAGYVIRPIYIAVQAETPLIAADDDEAEILVAVDSLGLWTGDGTFTSEIPSNLRADLDKGSGCRVGSAFSADMTTTPGYAVAAAADPVLDMELARALLVSDVQGTAANALWGSLGLVYEPKYPPFLVGPATLLIYVGGTVAVNAYAQVHWIEGKKSDLLPAI